MLRLLVTVSVSDRGAGRAPNTIPLAVGDVESSDRATDSEKARGPVALRRRFDAFLATPLRAHFTIA